MIPERSMLDTKLLPELTLLISNIRGKVVTGLSSSWSNFRDPLCGDDKACGTGIWIYWVHCKMETSFRRDKNDQNQWHKGVKLLTFALECPERNRDTERERHTERACLSPCSPEKNIRLGQKTGESELYLGSIRSLSEVFRGLSGAVGHLRNEWAATGLADLDEAG